MYKALFQNAKSFQPDPLVLSKLLSTAIVTLIIHVSYGTYIQGKHRAEIPEISLARIKYDKIFYPCV